MNFNGVRNKLRKRIIFQQSHFRIFKISHLTSTIIKIRRYKIYHYNQQKFYYKRRQRFSFFKIHKRRKLSFMKTKYANNIYVCEIIKHIRRYLFSFECYFNEKFKKKLLEQNKIINII